MDFINKLKIVIITLDRNIDRLKKYKKMFNNDIIFNKFNIFYGIDGNKLDILKYNNNHILGIFCPKYVIGCGLSHILVWEYLSKTLKNNEYGLILEDDSIIEFNKLTNNIITFIENNINDSIIFLYKDNVIHKNNIIINNFKEITNIWSAAAYILNKSTATKLYNYYKINGLDYHIDVSLSIITKKINIKLYYYYLNNICYQIKVKTSMSNNNEKTLLKYLENSRFYYNFKVPVFKLNHCEFNSYAIILTIIILLTLILMKYINYYILILLYLLYGILFWDIIENFI